MKMSDEIVQQNINAEMTADQMPFLVDYGVWRSGGAKASAQARRSAQEQLSVLAGNTALTCFSQLRGAANMSIV